MSKAKAPVAAAPAAAATPEPPRQTAETAAETGLPTVAQAPEPPESAPSPEVTPETAPEPTQEEREREAVQKALDDKEEFVRFLMHGITDSEFSQLLGVVLAEAQRRNLPLPVSAPEAAAPVTAPTADPYFTVRATMRAEGISTAYVLPDGTWRFSEAYALKAVEGNHELLTVIEA